MIMCLHLCGMSKCHVSNVCVFPLKVFNQRTLKHKQPSGIWDCCAPTASVCVYDTSSDKSWFRLRYPEFNRPHPEHELVSEREKKCEQQKSTRNEECEGRMREENARGGGQIRVSTPLVYLQCRCTESHGLGPSCV